MTWPWIVFQVFAAAGVFICGWIATDQFLKVIKVMRDAGISRLYLVTIMSFGFLICCIWTKLLEAFVL